MISAWDHRTVQAGKPMTVQDDGSRCGCSLSYTGFPVHAPDRGRRTVDKLRLAPAPSGKIAEYLPAPAGRACCCCDNLWIADGGHSFPSPRLTSDAVRQRPAPPCARWPIWRLEARLLGLGLIPQQRRRAIAPAALRRTWLALDQPVVAQHRDPGIPVAAGRLFAEGGGEIRDLHKSLAFRDKDAQHLGRRRPEPGAP